MISLYFINNISMWVILQGDVQRLGSSQVTVQHVLLVDQMSGGIVIKNISSICTGGCLVALINLLFQCDLQGFRWRNRN